MEPAGTVLILSRAAADWREATDMLAGQRGYRVIQAKTAADAAAYMADIAFDVAIAENGPEDTDGLAFFSRLRKSQPATVRLLVVGAKASLPRNAAKEAAIYFFLRRPFDAEQLALAIQRGLEAREMARRHRLLARSFQNADDRLDFDTWQVAAPSGEPLRFGRLVYVSEAMAEICAAARDAAPTDVPILIQGEAGTGKELLARAMHSYSARRDGPFIVQNCSGMSETALYAEMFGRQPDEIAPGHADRQSALHAAHGGTIFLDEIAETSKVFQLSLLRFLQRIDAERPDMKAMGRADVRVIAASSRPLSELTGGGTFRQDLYFRLRGVELDLPPLRDRQEDIPVLADAFAIRQGETLGRRFLGISAKALEKLATYDFPGNVSELESEIQRMAALARDGEYLTTRLMSPSLLAAADRSALKQQAAFPASGKTLKDKVESLERQIVREALVRHKWNRSRVAEELGLSRVGLSNKIKRYGLNVPR
jgi:two-component system, NtrC family, response regulator HupR/HoxA